MGSPTRFYPAHVVSIPAHYTHNCTSLMWGWRMESTPAGWEYYEEGRRGEMYEEDKGFLSCPECHEVLPPPPPADATVAPSADPA